MSESKEIELEKKIDRILSILEDDDATKKTGLVGEVRKNTKDLGKIKNQLKIMAGVFATISAIFAKLKNLV